MTKLSFILVDPLASFGDLAGLEAAFRTLRELGYCGVEFNLASSDLGRVDELLRLADDVKLPVASLLTGANYFGGGLCLSSPDDDVRRRAVDTLMDLTAAAARFDAVLVVGQMQGFRSDEANVEVAESRIEEGLRQVAEVAERLETTVVLEPVNHLQCGFHHTLDAVMGLTDRVASLYVKPMLDSFHMNIEEPSMTTPIQRVGKDLGHFHLCESSGGLLGTGHLDFGQILEDLDAIDYAGHVSVKVYREPWELAAKSSMEHLQGLLSS